MPTAVVIFAVIMSTVWGAMLWTVGYFHNRRRAEEN